MVRMMRMRMQQCLDVMFSGEIQWLLLLAVT